MNSSSFYVAGFTLVILFLLYFLLQSVLLYLGISFALALMAKPLYTLLKKLKYKSIKITNPIAAIICLISYFAIIFFIFNAFAPFVFKQAKQLTTIQPNQILKAIHPVIHKIELFIYRYTDEFINLEVYLREKLVSLLTLANFKSIVNSLTLFTGNLFVAFFAISFMTFFFIKDGEKIVTSFMRLFPKKYRLSWIEIQPQIRVKLSRYFTGIAIEISIVFLCLFLGLWIVGLENFALVALCAAVFNVIPYLGPLIGILIGLIFTIVGAYEMEFYGEMLPLLVKVLVVFIATQLLDNIVLQPLIYSTSINAHPMEIFLIILISGNLFGILGMILAIPAYTIIRIAIKEVKSSSDFLKKLYD